MGIPFIVPGSQTFIPNSVIDLRERFPQPTPKPRQTLSPAAQCTVLYHLLSGNLANTPLNEIARRVRYSPTMLTKVKDELEAAKICKIIQNGRALMLDFKASGRPLWDQVKPALSSPVKKSVWVQSDASGQPVLLAGMSALSLRTMIADDRLPTYALPHDTFEDFLKRGVCADCQDAENATARMEVWCYDPKLLGDDRIVDPLSLYLSLEHSADERVQQQLEQLIEGVKW